MKEELEFHDPSSRPWEAVEGVSGLYERIIAGQRGSPDHSRMLPLRSGLRHVGDPMREHLRATNEVLAERSDGG
jgi:hypothetical protein